MVADLTLQIGLLSAAFFVLLWSNPLTVVLAQSWVPDHRGTVSSLLMGFAWGVVYDVDDHGTGKNLRVKLDLTYEYDGGTAGGGTGNVTFQKSHQLVY